MSAAFMAPDGHRVYEMAGERGYNFLDLDDYYETLSYATIFNAVTMPNRAVLSDQYFRVMYTVPDGPPLYECIGCPRSYYNWEKLMNHQHKKHNVDVRTRVECKLCKRPNDPHPIVLADYRLHAQNDCNSCERVAYHAALLDPRKTVVVRPYDIKLINRNKAEQPKVIVIQGASQLD